MICMSKKGHNFVAVFIVYRVCRLPKIATIMVRCVAAPLGGNMLVQPVHIHGYSLNIEHEYIRQMTDAACAWIFILQDGSENSVPHCVEKAYSSSVDGHEPRPALKDKTTNGAWKKVPKEPLGHVSRQKRQQP